MKFCPLCKRVIAKGSNKCSYCNQASLEGTYGAVKSDNRRGYVRVPYEETVNFQVLSLDPQGKNLALQAKAKNISLSGIFFETNTSSFLKSSSFIRASSYLKVSNIIWMQFMIPTSPKPIKTQGEIRRIWKSSGNNISLGIMFVNMSRHDYRNVDKFISFYLEGKKEI